MDTATTSVSSHDFWFACDMMHPKLDEGSLVEYLFALGSCRDHDVGRVNLEIISLPWGAWVSHVAHRRVVGDGGPRRRCGWCVRLFRCEGRDRGEFCKWWRWETRDVLSKFLSKFELGDGRQMWWDWKW